MGLTKEQFAAAPVHTIKVDAPELGGDGHVWLRKLSVKGREDWECWAQDASQGGIVSTIRKYGGWRGYLLQRTLCDQFGVLLFNDTPEDLAILNGADGQVVDRLYDAAVEFNGLTPEAEKELAGNSPSDPSEDSS